MAEYQRKIFLNKSSNILDGIYTDIEIDRICSLVDIEKGVYTKDMVLDNPNLFKETEYIFSTWGMPTFADDEALKHITCK